MAGRHPFPTNLKIGKRRYTVQVQRRFRKSVMGQINYYTQQIAIATHSGITGRQFRPAELQDTFWHEVTHGILYEMDHPYHRNEKFVRRFAELLTRAIASAKFD